MANDKAVVVTGPDSEIRPGLELVFSNVRVAIRNLKYTIGSETTYAETRAIEEFADKLAELSRLANYHYGRKVGLLPGERK